MGSKLFFDPIAKSLIEKNLTRDTGRVVSIQKVTTNLLKGSISIANFKIKNDKIFSRENLISIPLTLRPTCLRDRVFCGSLGAQPPPASSLLRGWLLL